MARINRVSRLQDCGVFRDFTWPNDMPELGQYNLIYGWNGTGKTTLSRVFRDLELRAERTTGKTIVRIDGKDFRGEDFPKSDLQIRVFNRDFVSSNVFPVAGSNMPPILVLGAESVEKQQEVQRLKAQEEAARSSLAVAQSEQRTASAESDRFCIDRARAIKDALRSSGRTPYNNYNKANFQADVEEMIGGGRSVKKRLTESERAGLLARVVGRPKPKLDSIAYVLPDFREIQQRLSNLLATSVVSAAIEALKADPALAAWTEQGLMLHRDQSVHRCLFCEQPLPKARLTALEGHFSTQYDQFIGRIEQELTALRVLSKTAAEVPLPRPAEFYDDLAPEFESSAEAFSELVEDVRRFLEEAVEALENKRSRVFEQVPLTLSVPSIGGQALERLNSVVRRHNEVSDGFSERAAEAREQLATDMVVAELDEFVHRRDAMCHALMNAQTVEEEVSALAAQIAALEREIVEHRKPAEELNIDLHRYLGHGELRLKVEETGYTITRSGVAAETLSEGETTAIALLYFLKSLNDRRFSPSNGVIVLDDPVSSLDANALFLAFGFIRNRTQDAAQLIILTHNFSFFRQIRNWFHHIRGQRKQDPSQRPARFFMLASKSQHGSRVSTIRGLDPLLERYESEYQYLFARVYRATTGALGLEDNYVLPNMARRMLEAFLAFRQPQISGELWQKLKAVNFDEAKKLRILRFLHTQSHSIEVGEPEHDLTALAEGPSVLSDLMEMIACLDKAHYSAMVQLAAPSTNP